MADVFISYSRKNSEFARRLIDKLIVAGKDTWVDWEGIPLTSPNWWAEIKAGIEGANNFICIVSPDSMASVVCNMELDYAFELGKRIVPVIYEEVQTREAFASIADFTPDEAMKERLEGSDTLAIARDNWQRLSHINWIFFKEDVDFEHAFEELVKAVEIDLAYVKVHTRYLTRAKEWEHEHQRADLLLFGGEIDVAEAWLAQARSYTASANEKQGEKSRLQPVQETYILASRRAQNRRRFIAVTGTLIAVVAIIFAIAASLIGTQAIANANSAAQREATAQDQANIAATQAADAEQREAQASTQVAYANTQLTAIPPTLTQAASIRQQAEDERSIASEFNGALLQMETDTDGATERMNHLVEQFPGYPSAHYSRGLFHARLNNHELAAINFTQAIDLGLDNTEIYSNRGWAYYNAEDYDSAIPDFNRVLGIEPQNVTALTGRGWSHYQLEDFEAAIADFDRAIELDTDNGTAYTGRGWTYYNLGNSEAAVADFDHAIELDADNGTAYTGRAWAYRNLGNLEAAILDYTQLIRVDPQNHYGYQQRGDCYYDLGHIAEAIEDYRRYVALADDPEPEIIERINASESR